MILLTQIDKNITKPYENLIHANFDMGSGTKCQFYSDMYIVKYCNDVLC